MEQTLNKILKELNDLNSRQKQLDEKFNNLQSLMNQIKNEQSEDIKDITQLLLILNKEIESHKVDLEYVSEQQGKQDMILNRIEKLTQS